MLILWCKVLFSLVLSNAQFRADGQPCTELCYKKGRYFKCGNGSDKVISCSLSRHEYRGYECRNDCEKRGESYYWCNYKWGGSRRYWGYCSPGCSSLKDKWACVRGGKCTWDDYKYCQGDAFPPVQSGTYGETKPKYPDKASNGYGKGPVKASNGYGKGPVKDDGYGGSVKKDDEDDGKGQQGTRWPLVIGCCVVAVFIFIVVCFGLRSCCMGSANQQKKNRTAEADHTPTIELPKDSREKAKLPEHKRAFIARAPLRNRGARAFTPNGDGQSLSPRQWPVNQSWIPTANGTKKGAMEAPWKTRDNSEARRKEVKSIERIAKNVNYAVE